ncbi:vomeronasal type-2 receptor 116-like [Perognathus longimembris pacificus]|uniref:vomeronasal type-2 receptor 116-like n=1 Tax=Perognathus longimembris pacificus TaxID=214514 RepID=UPI002018C2D5|nr:vomeronasal type-2 receptor 116-like [Perognathus longimembris pacificus]
MESMGDNPKPQRERVTIGKLVAKNECQEDTNCSLLHCFSCNVSVNKEKKLSKCNDGDGCILETLYCAGCSLNLGYTYRYTPKNINYKQNLFSLSVEAIESYALGSSEKQMLPEDKELFNLESRAEIEKSLSRWKMSCSCCKGSCGRWNQKQEITLQAICHKPFTSPGRSLEADTEPAQWPSRALKGNSCFSTMKKRVHMDGDVMIAAYFPLYILTVPSRDNDATQHEKEMRSAILCFFGKYNTLNYTCMGHSKYTAVLTGPSAITSARFGTLMNLYRFPQLSFGPFDQVLGDHYKFPALYQMARKDTSMATAMVSLLLHFRWNWVGLLTVEDDNGLWFLSELKEEMAKNRVCVDFELALPNNILFHKTKLKAVNDQVNKSSANVFIIYGDHEFLLVMQLRITSKIFILNSQWDLSMSRDYFLLGSSQIPLMFSHHHPDVSGFTEFVKAVNPSKYPEDIFLAEVWLVSFNCSNSESDCVTWENCAHNASLDLLPRHVLDMTLSVDSYNIYNAVYTVAHALHEMLLHQAEVKPWETEKGQCLLLHIWDRFHHKMVTLFQLHPFLKKIQFHNPAGDQVILDETRKLEAEYDIVNIWNFPHGLHLEVKVGKFSPYAHQLYLSEEVIHWTIAFTEDPHSVCSISCGPGFRKAPREGKAACCFDCTPCSENEMANGTDMEQCVKCPDHQYANTQRNRCLLRAASFLAYGEPLGMALACMALGLSTLTALVLGVFVKHHNTPIVKANNQTISHSLLISLIFCSLCSLLYIGRPNTVTCILQQTIFAVAFTVAVSAVLAKTVTVILAFKVTSPWRRMRRLLVSGAPNFIIPICLLIQVTLCGIWLGTSPPFIDTDTHSEHGRLIILCNKGSLTAFYCVLGYMGSLALASFTVAFQARKLPDTFNEAKFLTFSMLVFCSVWLTFLPVYHSAKGKVMVAVEVFSILASSAGLLGCIFVPKCYIILMRPERNCLHGFRDKRH